MAKYLIEVPHEESTQACARAVKHFLETGSHFMTHANWGCKDGVHKAWLVVEMDSKDEARHVVPTEYRAAAKIVKVNEFNMQEIDEILSEHKS